VVKSKKYINAFIFDALFMSKDKAKHTIIVDADLHIQDPHDIILSYFNTGNDNQLARGKKTSFRMKLIFLFLSLVLLKFFFEEKFTNPFFFIISVIVFGIMGIIIAYGVTWFATILNSAVKKDGIRGLFFQLTFITIIVLVIAMFG